MRKRVWLCRQRDSRCRLAWVPGLACSLLAILMVVGCEGLTRAPTYTELRVHSAKALLPGAFAVAREWKPDAYLVDISVDMVPEAEGAEIPTMFGFQSPSDDYHSLGVWCSRVGYCWPEIFGQVVPVRQSVPIEPDDFQIDSIEAAEIGQRNGGEAFIRRKHVAMDVRLERYNPRGSGSVLWSAAYLDYTSRDFMYIYIDAMTGEVVETKP